MKDEMRFKEGQKVKINKRVLNEEQNRTASSLTPPYIATISHIEPDPHSGKDMYRFKECPWGWYDTEIEDLYIEKTLNKIEKARKLFKEALEEDEGLRWEYQSNIALLLHKEFDLTIFEDKNKIANDILKLICDIEGEFINYDYIDNDDYHPGRPYE